MPPKKETAREAMAEFLKHVFLGVGVASGLYAALESRIDRLEGRVEKRIEKIESRIDGIEKLVYSARE